MHNTWLQAGEEQSFGASPGLQGTLSSEKHQGLGTAVCLLSPSFSLGSQHPPLLHRGTSSLKSQGQPQPLFSSKHLRGDFSLEQDPKPGAPLPSSGSSEARVGARPFPGPQLLRVLPRAGSQPHTPIPAHPSETTSMNTGPAFQLGSGSSFREKQLWLFSAPQGHHGASEEPPSPEGAPSPSAGSGSSAQSP